MKKLVIEVKQRVEISIDENSEYVKSYDSESELISDIVSYKFSNVLPVISNGGVVIDDIEVLKHDSYNL
jgi:hypothetical protein